MQLFKNNIGTKTGCVSAFFILAITFSFSFDTEDPFHALRWIILSFASISGLAILFFDPTFAFSKRVLSHFKLLFILLSVYILFTLISLYSAINKAEGFWQVAQSCIWGGWFLAVLFFAIYKPFFWRIVRRGAVVCALFAAIDAIGEYWGLWRIHSELGTGPGGLFGNRNLLASIEFLFCPWVVWALLCEKIIFRVLAMAAWAVICYTLVITQCRAVWLGCLMTFVTAWFFIFTHFHFSFFQLVQRRLKLLIVMNLCVILAFSTHHFFKPAIDTRGESFERMASIGDPAFNSNAQRISLWKKTIQLVGKNPIIGVGAGNWKIVLPSLGMTDLLWQNMEVVEVRPYNDWLWTFSEIGIIGGLCWLGIWIVGIVAGYRLMQNGSGTTIFPAALLLTSGLIGFGVVSSFDFPKERAEHMAWYALGLSALFTLGVNNDSKFFHQQKQSSHVAWNFQRIIVGSLLLLVLFCAIFSLARWRNEKIVHQIFEAQKEKDWPRLLGHLKNLDERVCNLNPATSPLAWHGGIAEFQLGHRNAAEKFFQHSLELHPYHIQTLYNMAICRLATTDTAEAEMYLQRALNISPHFTKAATLSTLLYLHQAQYNLARQTLDRIQLAHRDSEWNTLNLALMSHERTVP